MAKLRKLFHLILSKFKVDTLILTLLFKYLGDLLVIVELVFFEIFSQISTPMPFLNVERT